MPPGWLNEQQDLLEVLRWELETLRDRLEATTTGTEQLLEPLARAHNYCQRAEQLLGQLRGEEPRTANVPLVKLLRGAVVSLRVRLEERFIVQEELLEAEVEVQGDEIQLECILLGLLLDLFKETPPGEPWRHDLAIRAHPEGGMLWVEFRVEHSTDALCEAYLAQEPSDQEEPPQTERWHQYAATLKSYNGHFEVEVAEGSKLLRVGLPVVEPPVSQRPTTRLPTSGYPKATPSAHDQPTQRPGAPRRKTLSPGIQSGSRRDPSSSTARRRNHFPVELTGIVSTRQ